MAQSRLEKIGTIFTRVTGLLRSGAMKSEDKPIWYDVYAAFPPKLEPRFDRPAPNVEIRKIFYEEDIVRAKYHKSVKYVDMVNLTEGKRESQCQQFIQIYNDFREQGALDSEQIFATAKDVLAERRQQMRPDEPIVDIETTDIPKPSRPIGLSQSFVAAKSQTTEETKKDKDKKKTTPKVDIENLFKE